MKLAMAQMAMSARPAENLARALAYFRRAEGCDLLFFPEIQLTPFFPQYPGRDVSGYVTLPEGPEIAAFREAARRHRLYASPNVYLEQNGRRYDTSLWLTPEGELAGMAKMVHIAQAEQFYEQDYYAPSDDGFHVFDTTFGRVGIVICFDRHLPESIRTCALKGAQLVIIPTANTKAEPGDQFEWELRVQARQNGVYIAMCNRVGLEDGMDFCGASMVAGPDGELVAMADDREQLITVELDLSHAAEVQRSRPYLSLRRTEWYL